MRCHCLFFRLSIYTATCGLWIVITIPKQLGKISVFQKKNTVDSPKPQNIQCVCMEEPQDCNIIWRGIITHTAKYLVLRLFSALYFFFCCINIWTHIKKPVINESLWAYVFIVRNNGQYTQLLMIMTSSLQGFHARRSITAETVTVFNTIKDYRDAK